MGDPHVEKKSGQELLADSPLEKLVYAQVSWDTEHSNYPVYMQKIFFKILVDKLWEKKWEPNKTKDQFFRCSGFNQF